MKSSLFTLKRLGPALLLVGLSQGAHAQQATPPLTRADTVQAVRHLFQRHRTGGWIWTAVGGAAAVRIITVAASSNSSGSFSSTAGGTVVGVGLLGGVPAGIGIGKLARFSNAKEEQVVTLYEKSGILPPYVRKRLKPRVFRKYK